MITTISIPLGRPLQVATAVVLALGSPGGPGADYDAALRLVVAAPSLAAAAVLGAPPYDATFNVFAQPPSLRSAAVLDYNLYDAVANLTGAAPSLRGVSSVAFQPYDAAIRVLSPPPTLAAVAPRASNLVYWTSGGAWRDLKPCFGLGWTFPWTPAPTIDLQSRVSWRLGLPLDNVLTVPWDRLAVQDHYVDAQWPSFEPINVIYSMPWPRLLALDVQSWSPWQPRFAQRLDPSLTVFYHFPPYKDRSWLSDWRGLASFGLDRSSGAPYNYPPQKDRRFMEFPWGPGGPPDYSVHYGLPPVVEPKPATTRPSYVCFDLNRAVPPSTSVQLRLRRPLRSYCDTGTFIVNNALNVITLIDGLNLECTGVSLKLDISSFAWDISLTLATHEEFGRVKPSALQDGAREVQITINGYVWRGFIDTVSVSRQFGNPSYTAQGRSFTAYGAAPFAPLTSLVSTSDELTQQLVNDAFGYSGFTITWDALDWVVPAGLLAYENKDPMGVAAQICEAGGMFILPGRYDKSFTVRSRYPITSWHWNDDDTPVASHIGINQMINASARFQAGVDYTKVYVGGTEQGNTVGCTRDGTAGDSQAPAITNPLLATDDAATERGRVELSKAGSRIFNTYVTPLVAVTESGMRLREVGELVVVDEDELDDAAYKGLITSVQIDGVRTGVGELTVYQTLEVERYVQPVVSL